LIEERERVRENRERESNRVSEKENIKRWIDRGERCETEDRGGEKREIGVRKGGEREERHRSERERGEKEKRGREKRELGRELI
jgi:hypothetical protein